jgi:hypothetical protein
MDIDVTERLSLTLIFLLCLDFFLKGVGVETDSKLIEILPNFIWRRN